MKINRAALPAFVIAAALAFPAQAEAQAQAQQAGDQIVVTAQQRNATEVINGGSAGVLGNKAAEDLPFAVRSYSESVILNQQPQTLGEVLENDPTIRSTYGFGNAAELFVIRGFALNGDDIGLNGLYGIAPRQLIAPELFSSVQVLNGSSAFLNGAAPGGSGLGGSVNLMLKRAGDRDTSRVTAGYTGQEHLGASFDVSRRFGANGEWGLRVNGAYRNGEVAIDREDRRTQVLGAALDWRGDALRVALDLAYQEVRVDALRPKVTLGTATAIPAVPRADYNYAQDFTYTEMRDLIGMLSAEYDVSEDVMLYARGGARDGREEGIYSGLTLTSAATGAATGNASFIPRTDNNEALEAGIRAGLATGTIGHEVNFGGNMSWQNNRNAYDFRQNFATSIYDAPVAAYPASSFAGGNLADPFTVGKSRLSSLFLSDTLSFMDGQVLLTGGVRLQEILTDSFSYATGDRSTRYKDSAWTPIVGLVVKPVPGLSLYANRVEALQQGATAPIDQTIVNSGEALAPRKSVQYELGGKLAVGTLFAGLSVYQIERPGEGRLPDNSYGYIGDQQHQGIELTLNGDLQPGLRLISGLAVTDTDLNDNEVLGVPGFTANAGLEWDAAFAPGLTLTGRVVHTGSQWANLTNTLKLESWTTFDLGARYVFVAGETPLTLRLNVDNVANERYWASAFDSFNPALLQGTPRTVKASITADF